MLCPTCLVRVQNGISVAYFVLQMVPTHFELEIFNSQGACKTR